MVAVSGCAQQTFKINGAAEGVAKEDTMQPFFIAGIGQTQKMDAAAICGGASKVAAVESQTTFLDGVMGMLTWGIYTPRDARVYCTK